MKRYCWRMFFLDRSAAKSPRAARGPLSQRGLFGPLLWKRRDREDFASNSLKLALPCLRTLRNTKGCDAIVNLVSILSPVERRRQN